MSSIKFITSGEVARRLGVSITTVKNYERKGILTPDRILPTGRRLYNSDKVDEICNSLTKGGTSDGCDDKN